MHKIIVVYLGGEPLPWWAWLAISFSFTSSVLALFLAAGAFVR